MSATQHNANETQRDKYSASIRFNWNNILSISLIICMLISMSYTDIMLFCVSGDSSQTANWWDERLIKIIQIENVPIRLARGKGNCITYIYSILIPL